MHTYIATLIETFVILLFIMLPFAIYAITKRRNDLADVFWGLSFIVIAWTSYFARGTQSKYALIVNVLVTIWGLRLSNHIYKRFKRSEKEDFRYAEMRKKWKINQDLASFYYVFCLQALLAMLVTIPVTLINTFRVGSNSFFAIFGIIIWIFGFIYEARADSQLKEFVSGLKNRGKLMTKGLWKYSRHPNYFGELLQWWGIAYLALYVQHGVYGLIGALTITVLITKVSGVPLAEKSTSQKKGWEEYKNKTPSLIPKLKI